MTPSPFPPRARSRGVLAAQSVQQVFREVRTEDELRQALQPLNVMPGASAVADFGRRIVYTAPITLKSPIVVDVTLPGVTIESHGHLPITCGTDGIDAFDVRAALFTLRGVLLFARDLSPPGTPMFRRGVSLSGFASLARIVDCHIMGCDSAVVGELDVDDAHIRDCTVATVSGRPGDCIAFAGDGWRIMGNRLNGSGGGLAIRGGVGSEYAAIVGNECGNDGINTAAGSGTNTISANTRVGVLTAHGTDNTTGGNT